MIITNFSFKGFTMASAVVAIPDAIRDKSSRIYLVSWYNNLLKTNFKDVQEMGSGD